jgi:beta-lactam-binding protein with PASTA domain
MKKFLRFFISKQFLLNVVAIIVVWVLFIWILSWYLWEHTNQEDAVAVPSFYKVHIDDLDLFVKDKDLSYEIQDSVYLDDWEKGTVCWQYPRPTDSTGMKVKPGRKILLSVVPMNPKMISMPDVVDMSKRMAEMTLGALGMKTKITYQPAVEGKDFVIKQLYNGKPINPGTFVPKGSRIELIVAQGQTGETTVMPNLMGLTISQARERLTNLTITLSVTCDDCKTEAEIERAIIYKQSPEGGDNAVIMAGTTATVWASSKGMSTTGTGN